MSGETSLEPSGEANGRLHVTYLGAAGLGGQRSSHDHLVAGRLCLARQGSETQASVQVRPIPTACTSPIAASRLPAFAYTEREAELVALMPEKVKADMSKFLLCPMPGLVKAIHVQRGSMYRRVTRSPSSKP